MNPTVERSNYDSLLLEIIGKVIRRVSYFEIDCGEPSFEKSDHHSLDYGLQFDISAEESYYMIWDSQNIQFDLKFAKGQLMDELNPEAVINCYDVSKSLAWMDQIGQKIVNVQSHWRHLQHLHEGRRIYYPQDIEFTFENGQIVTVSALEIAPDGRIGVLADHISVFFNSETAQKYGARCDNN